MTRATRATPILGTLAIAIAAANLPINPALAQNAPAAPASNPNRPVNIRMLPINPENRLGPSTADPYGTRGVHAPLDLPPLPNATARAPRAESSVDALRAAQAARAEALHAARTQAQQSAPVLPPSQAVDPFWNPYSSGPINQATTTWLWMNARNGQNQNQKRDPARAATTPLRPSSPGAARDPLDARPLDPAKTSAASARPAANIPRAGAYPTDGLLEYYDRAPARSRTRAYRFGDVGGYFDNNAPRR